MSNVFKSFRGKALAWFGSLSRSNIDTSNWTNFKKTFLKTYGTGNGNESESAVKPTFIDIADLKQGQDEKVMDFYSRVVKVIIY